MNGRQREPGRGVRPGPGGPHAGLVRPVERARDFRGTVRRLVRYLLPRRRHIALVVLLAVMSTLFGVISPRLLGNATTLLYQGMVQRARGVGGGVDFAALQRIIFLLLVLYVASSLFTYLQQFIMAGIAQRTVARMREEVSRRLSRLPLSYFDARTHGEILSRVTNDIDTIASTLQQSLTQLISALVSLVGVLVMMVSISPLLTMVAVVTLPVTVLVTRWVAARSQKYYAGQQRELGELNGHVEEMLGGHRVVKAFGREADSLARFEAINHRLFGVAWKAQFMSGTIMPLMMLIGNVGYVLVSVGGAILVTRQAITIGDVQAFIQYSRHFTHPITQTANIANIIQSTVAAAERVFELLDEREEAPDPADALRLQDPRGDVRFEHVRFGYQPGPPLMEDLNFEVRAGQTVAIVGPTGAGKTTLVNLLMRFYEVDGGRITVDGFDIRRLTRESLRQAFGMVLQDAWLFNGTIRDNIAYGRQGAGEEEVVRAAVAARADHFIRTLPEGYDTVLNEEASNISQGQKQLLTIARALLADPAILILDEATSSVDTRTELLIQQATAELMRGRTSFVIAHRLSTIRHADLILVMNQGTLVEQGTHAGRLEKGGFYAQLYRSQFTGSLAADQAG
ncbi:MAG: ABC transporter ATP-binding protein/permease [Syntrophomonadaceae bacterium]|nr:ABC transporter ATP-binding protein/permease [Syntrophomonadaceae bacterium]